MNKVEVFQKHIKSSKQIFLVMIVVTGLKKNLWSEDLVNGVVELKELF